MAAKASFVFAHLLLAISVVLSVWGVLGAFEYIWGHAPITPLQNPEFPDGVQALHWIVISASGIGYLFGYLLRWPITPYMMMIIYSMMAALCFVQTLDFLTNSGRYLAMAVEYVAYITIGVYLFRSQRMRRRFGLE